MNQEELIGLEVIVPEEVRPYEQAARAYMKLRGELTGIEETPDDFVPQAHPTLQDVLVKMPMWVFSAQRLIELSLMLTALRQSFPSPKTQ